MSLFSYVYLHNFIYIKYIQLYGDFLSLSFFIVYISVCKPFFIVISFSTLFGLTNQNGGMKKRKKKKLKIDCLDYEKENKEKKYVITYL